MAWLFNHHSSRSIIRANEYTDAGASFMDEHGRELTLDGKLIRLSDFTTLMDNLQTDYEQHVKDEIFFGENLPEQLKLTISLRDIADNPHNRSAGWCFLDHPDNPFHNFQNSYGEWLLSDPERADTFTYIQLVWRPDPALRLMHAFDLASDKLILRAIFGAGGSGRATDLAAQNLRNRPVCSIRNLQFLYHNLTLLGIQDKTSHKRMKDRYIPHSPSLRFPGSRFLTCPRRFHEALWPRLSANLSSNDLSRMMGDLTEDPPVGVRLPITKYRKIVSTFLRKHGDPRQFEVAKTYFFDVVAHHSAKTANAVYQQDRDRLPGISPEHVVGYHPLSVSAVGLEPLLDEHARALTIEDPEDTRVDTHSIANGILAILQPRLEKIIDNRITRTTQYAQALYWPRPKPTYSPHDVRPISDVRPHGSRLPALRQVLPDFKVRCPETMVLVEKMIARETNVLVNMGCGTGKTLIGLVAAKAFANGRKTIFILPHSGLHQDFRRRARDLTITHSKWDPKGEFNSDVEIIYAAVEHIDFESFQIYLHDLCNMDRVAWIIFDEIHKLFTDSRYRPIFEMIPSLAQYGVPILGFSGTIPPCLMNDFFRLTGIDRWDLIKTRTSRANALLYVTDLPAGLLSI
ncbi:hypothetical protein B0H13DRAFT_2328778 [Mycena leptocephala]|nr:hypothetical protein B0H13DRAFT_2328778 [Mycena leptocephala]